MVLGATPLILVADGDKAYRARLKTLLKRSGYKTVEAADGPQALEVGKRTPPALVLLEVNLASVSGYEVCRELRATHGDQIAIIFVSGERTEPFDRAAGLLLGADDYVVKPFDEGELLARIRSSLRHAKSGPRVDPNGSSLRIASLTAREREVLKLLSRGLTQMDIASRLVISPKTVGTHIQRILSKLGVHSRAQAVVLAHEQGLPEGAGSLVDVESHALVPQLDSSLPTVA